MSNALIQLDRVARDLAKCDSFDWAKEIRDRAIALETYAKSKEAERQCAVIRAWAERRLGELLPKLTKRGRPKMSNDETFKLAKLGITRTQSSQFQATAKLRLKTFTEYVNTASKPTTKGVLKLVQEQERTQQAKKGARSGGNILTGPASQLWDKLRDGSVDLFLTDPPYSKVELYGELAELAAAKLKPGRLCLAYCGQWFLPQVLEAMGRHLTFHWIIAIKFSGPHHAVHGAKIQNSWQPVVVFRKGKSVAGWVTDFLHSSGREKDLHEWQCNQSDVEYLIEKLTDQRALVVDPFCGSGTVPTACKILGRNWLCCELDSSTARIARGRVAA